MRINWPDGRPWTSGYVTQDFHKAVVAAGVTMSERYTYLAGDLRAAVNRATATRTATSKNTTP